MSRLSKPLITIFVVLALVAVGAWFFRGYLVKSSNFIEPYKTLSAGATKHVYVAMDKTEWKLEVVQKVVAMMKDKVDFTVENLPTLSKINIADWDAVLIVAPLYMATLQEDASNFVNTTAAKQKILLLGTSGKTEVKAEGIDSISAASSDPDDTVKQVAGELNKKLGF